MENKEKINTVIEKIRPYLQGDGGDLELVKVEDNKVYVKIKGHCAACPMANMEIIKGIELAMQSEIPEIKEVIRVEE